jgi:signal transduction histidine kinase/DNA-binding response OmpR family regulator
MAAPRHAGQWMIGSLARYHQQGLRARFLLMFYLVTLLSMSVIGYFGFSTASNALRSKATELVAGYTGEAANKMDILQDLVRSDLVYLGHSQDLMKYLYWEDLRDEQKMAYWRSIVEDRIQGFASAYAYYYKIRFIGADGEERIGIKRDLHSGKISITPAGELWNDKDKDYFIRGMKLADGESYASTLSPNTEKGQIEKPLVPVVRFVMPVIGDNNVRYGVIVISLLADRYFQYAREANQIEASRQYYLIDGEGEGEYLFHPDQSKTFGRVLGHNAHFETDFPGVLERTKQFEQQQTLSSHGKILSLRHVHPNSGRHENGFILVGVADESVALAELNSFILFFFLLCAVVVVVVLAASRYYVGGLMGPLEFVTRQLQRLGRGETNREDLEYRADDEISRMLNSSRTLMANMERQAAQADVISKGDFSVEIPLLSDLDRLGIALNNMTRMLRESRGEELRNNWLKDGVSQLNQTLTGDLTRQQLADTAISLAGRILEAGRGVFYRFDKDEQTLELLGSYMFTEREALGNRFRLGEGAVGQAARERKPIILHALDDAAPIVTGTLSMPPRHTYTYPLLREGELVGVIELASFERYDDLKLEFINRAAEVMASFLYIVEQHGQIRGLLLVSEEATRQALDQSRRLQDANTMMEEQQLQLQQQTEELQASNAQMEEQQQQLQQQAEELMQTNAQLEEQQQLMAQQAQELERKNQDLNRSRDDLNQRAKELELASQYKSEFLANMSHELRTPLNSVILLSKMLAMNEEKHLSEEEVKRASIVHHSGEELLRLINDILDLSKIESGKMELNLNSIASSELAADFQDQFSATAQEKKLEFKVEDRLRGEFVSDRDKLSQVLRNLLSNAFKFTKQGCVTLRFENSGRSDFPLRIAVIDTGIGIAQDKQHLVFEAFQQLDGTISREFGGTGLGLSISQRFANLLGGTIELQSSPGEGSTFSLLLPMAIEHGKEAWEAEPTSFNREHLGAPVTALGRTRFQVHDDRTNLKTSDPVILVIDDDPGFCEALMMLNKQLGYKTLVASSGQEGLRMAKAYRPLGILLDLGLPDMDGGEVLHKLKSDRELRHLPVYVISARDKAQANLHERIVGYLQKPVSESQLADAEAKILLEVARQSSKLLLLEGQSLTRAKLVEILSEEDIAVTAVAKLPEAVEAMKTASWPLIVVDLARNEDEKESAEVCRILLEAAPEIRLILYSQEVLSADEEAALRRYTDSIIVNAPHAEQRMLENIERFLHDVPSGTEPLNGLTNTAKPEQSGKKLEGRRILVVDDDPRNLFVITSALEQHGAQVDNALNARKGLEYLRRQGADLVFMDIMMPEMDGYEAIRQIRSDARISRIPVVALTAKALKADHEKALESGADDYLSKPVDYEVLVNMAKVWCEEKR